MFLRSLWQQGRSRLRKTISALHGLPVSSQPKGCCGTGCAVRLDLGFLSGSSKTALLQAKKDDLCVARLAGVLTTIRLLRYLSTSVNKYQLIKIFVSTSISEGLLLCDVLFLCNVKMGILHSIQVLKMGILHITHKIKMGILNNLPIFYHTWRSETSNHNYEVDFLLSKGTKIRPIEVKSSGYKTHKSLDEFCRKYSGNVSVTGTFSIPRTCAGTNRLSFFLSCSLCSCNPAR